MTVKLRKTSRLMDRLVDRLAATAEAEVRAELYRILRPRLRNRKVRFQDAMGSITVDIDDRWGGYYVVNSFDAYRSGKHVTMFTWVGLDTAPWLAEVCELINAYSEISERLFAIEFELQF